MIIRLYVIEGKIDYPVILSYRTIKAFGFRMKAPEIEINTCVQARPKSRVAPIHKVYPITDIEKFYLEAMKEKKEPKIKVAFEL